MKQRIESVSWRTRWKKTPRKSKKRKIDSEKRGVKETGGQYEI